MSDDEDYLEWEEEYLFEDLVPDLVDDLAASANYEATLFEDPKLEVEDYLSDWEYYSDDYHDDDPTVKQNAAVAKGLDATSKTRRKHFTARSKRIPEPPASKIPDLTSFKGVIWRTPDMEDDHDLAVQIYEPGFGDKVALLEDWREIFKSAQPALDKSRLRKRRARDTPSVEPELADDEFPCDDDDQDSSDGVSRMLSSDDMAAKDDAGDASNTTPELMESPEKAVSMAEPAPVNRGRKRKAEIPAPDEPNKDNPGGDPGRSRAKRVASAHGVGKPVMSNTSSGPVRRSTRQRK